MPEPRVLLLDLDDTLYSEHEYVRSGFRAVAHYVAQRCGTGADALLAEMDQLLAAEGRGAIFNRIAERHGLLPPTHVPGMLHVYRAHTPTIALPPATRRALGLLRRAGFALGIITDGMASVQQRKLNALGLGKLVDFTLCTDDLGRDAWKPSELPYRVALEFFRLPPCRAAYVGDNVAKDFLAPRRLGMQTILTSEFLAARAPRPETPDHDAAHRITAFAELPSILESLLP